MGTITGSGRRGGHVVVLLISLRLLHALIGKSVLINIDGHHFSEVAVGVVSKMIRIRQDGLHRIVTSRDAVKLLGLINKEILEATGILIKDARCLNTKVINDLGGCGAYARSLLH